MEVVCAILTFHKKRHLPTLPCSHRNLSGSLLKQDTIPRGKGRFKKTESIHGASPPPGKYFGCGDVQKLGMVT